MERKIRVLSVCTSDSSGGAARAAYRIHLSVKALGVDSKMLVKHKGTEDDDVIPLSRYLPHNPFYRVFDWVRNKVKNKLQHYHWGKYPNRSKVFMSDMRSTDICGALKKIDYDVLHLHWVNLRFLPLDQLPKNKPIVWTLHDSWAFCGVCHYFLDCERYCHQCGCCPQLGSQDDKDLSHKIWLKKQAVFKDLDLHIVTPSRWLGECAKKSGLMGKFPITVIPNCVDLNVFRPLKEDEISSRWKELQDKRFEKPLLLYGAMNAATDKRKGFSNLISALQILEELGKGDSFEMIVFGTDKPIGEIPVSIPIHYVGYVSDSEEMVSLYNLAQVMIVPSLAENLSCVIMESMACGTPVVAFDIGGNGDMIDHRINGYLAKQKDDEELAKGILWCLENCYHCQLGENALNKVLKTYTQGIVGQSYRSLYSGILKSRN